MLSFLAHFTVALTLSSSVFGAVIPAAAAATSSALVATPIESSSGALFKNSVQKYVYPETSAVTPTAEIGGLTAIRRSGDLWLGEEHNEIKPIVAVSTGPALPRRSGELWRGLEHERVAARTF